MHDPLLERAFARRDQHLEVAFEDESMPVMRYNSVRRSKAGAFRLLFLPLGLGPMGCVGRSTLAPKDSRCFLNCRSQSLIFS